MKTADINDPTFLEAVAALDAGRMDQLQALVNRRPRLLTDRLITPGEEGYFKDPYLIWFVADNPIRNFSLPPNMVEITGFLVAAVKQAAPDSFLAQISYTLELVATGRIPRESGLQLSMMDVLIDAGATPGSAMSAIAHGNLEAAGHLINRGGKLTLASAILLGREEDAGRLINISDDVEKLTALTAAAFYGREEMVKHLLEIGVKPNGYPDADSGFHSHATPLHQAVFSASLDAVKLLVEAGAQLDIRDRIYGGTPLDWAMYMKSDTADQTQNAVYGLIAGYLEQAKGSTRKFDVP